MGIADGFLMALLLVLLRVFMEALAVTAVITGMQYLIVRRLDLRDENWMNPKRQT